VREADLDEQTRRNSLLEARQREADESMAQSLARLEADKHDLQTKLQQRDDQIRQFNEASNQASVPQGSQL